MPMPARFQRKRRPEHACSLKLTASFSLLLAVAALFSTSTGAARAGCLNRISRATRSGFPGSISLTS